MLRAHGHRGWWPGDTPFEVAVGAILTQNTNWSNVERAIANLRAADVLEPRPMFALPPDELAALIRPAGYFNVKARRLRAFLQVLVEECDGSMTELLDGPTPEVRARLLAINGIGRETADSILLYAGEHLSFVIDAYTKRIFERHGWFAAPGRFAAKTNSPEVYEALKELCEASLTPGRRTDPLDYWRDYHAQLVRVGNRWCRPKNPRCDECPLRPLLPDVDFVSDSGSGLART